ncbi:MAG: Maf-like protein [Prevotella sp.]|jgi:septum formation protein|nr:Maf-like protein [Prevotella sp.]
MTFGYKIILASNSPRRKELLSGLGLDYEVCVLPMVDESYPADLQVELVAEYIARKKAAGYADLLADSRTLVITADTVVVLDGKIYGKPKDEDDARQMLRDLSGRTHQVVSGVCLTTKDRQRTFSVTSEVRFACLEDSEIDYYVANYKPLDKAGSYGIQEWIGFVAVEYISGSFYNIMGLPVQRLYQELKKMTNN